MTASKDNFENGNSALQLMLKSIYVVFIFLFGFWSFLKFIGYTGSEIKIRAFPYPYKAGLSFAGDITGVATSEEFLSLQEYLCTDEMTPWGGGLSLELGTGFTFYDFEGKSQFTLFDTSGALNTDAAPVILDFIRSGHIDILNGFGNIPNISFNQDLLNRAVHVLISENLTVPVWINPPDEFGYSLGSMSHQLGDNKDSYFYHIPYLKYMGIEFIESSNYTHIVGQDVRFGFKGFLKKNYEFLLSIVKSSKSERWDVSGGNLLLQPFKLDDESEFFRFKRFVGGNPASTPEIIDARFLAEQLSPNVLDNLVSRNGYMILYANYGENTTSNEWLPIETRQALTGLSERAKKKEILVTTTSRLLDYNLVRKFLDWRWDHTNEGYDIYISGIKHIFDEDYDVEIEKFKGLTFYTPAPQNTRIYFDGKTISPITINPPDESGLSSVSIPWIWLNYPRNW